MIPDDFAGWSEVAFLPDVKFVAFLPNVKYVVVWDEDRDGWAVLTLDDGGAFS